MNLFCQADLLSSSWVQESIVDQYRCHRSRFCWTGSVLPAGAFEAYSSNTPLLMACENVLCTVELPVRRQPCRSNANWLPLTMDHSLANDFYFNSFTEHA